MAKPVSKAAKNRKATDPEPEGILSRIGALIKGDDGPRDMDPEAPIKATDLLTKDHDKVRALFKRYKDAVGAAKAQIAQEVSRELTIHAHIEEELFYPALQKSKENDTVKMVRESFEEHKIVKTLIQELAETSPRDPRFEAKFTVLQENVEHHADEEENDLFPDAERDLGDDRLFALGSQMRDRKDELMEQLEGRRKPSRSGSPKNASRPSGRSAGKSSPSRPRA
ncbi:MAG: hemerythrin domain-containing protein [Acidobacteriota bacterium]